MTRSTSLVGALIVLCGLAAAQTPRAVFPQVTGWKLTQEETTYNPNNLWDAIDGAADLYLEYDFVGMTLGRYVKSDTLEIKVELYEHASAADAFGIYSQERFPDYHFIDIGAQGYVERGALNFFAGCFYVKISSNQTGAAVQDGMLAIAKKVEEHLKQPKTLPPILKAFPAKGIRKNSEQYVARNFLGYSSLSGAYVVTYGDSSGFKAFAIRQETPELARKMLVEYLKGVSKDPEDSLSGGGYALKDPHNGDVQLFLKSNFLIGLIGTPNSDEGRLLLARIASNLSAQN